MPELPEVQTIVDGLNGAGLAGMSITDARVFWPRTVAGEDAKGFCRRIRGEAIGAIRRRGKYIIFDFASGAYLLIHLRMSGRLALKARGTPRLKHEHVILDLGSRVQLRFHDTRKFGRFYLTDDANSILDRLGPEPLGRAFSAKLLEKRLSGRRRQIKPLLLDQHFIAGLGNIYTDEALWSAGIHPGRQAGTLAPAEIRRLHRAIRKVLRQGLAGMGTTLGDGDTNFYSVAGRRGRNQDRLKVFRRSGLPCPRCQTPLVRLVVAQRGTHICPHCQQLP